MEREQAKNILLYCRDIDGEIKLNSKIIQDYEDRYYSAIGGTLNESFINSRNKVSKPTETLALNVPDFVSDHIRELQSKNKQLCKLKTAIMGELDNLPLVQKSVLYDFYIKGLQWVQISEQVHYSGTQCKTIRNRGLDNLAEQFSRNDLIKNFNYPS